MEVLVAQAEPVPHSQERTNDTSFPKGSLLINRRSKESAYTPRDRFCRSGVKTSAIAMATTGLQNGRVRQPMMLVAVSPSRWLSLTGSELID